MSQKTSDFLSSFGMMLFGIILLFFGSVKFSSSKTFSQNSLRLPQAGRRVLEIGGDITPSAFPVSRPQVPLLKDKSAFDKPLTAAAAIVVDDKSNTVLFKKNIDDVRPLASISKLMSALILADLPIAWSSTTIVLSDDVDTSSHHINIGEKFSLEDLWHIALIGSSNSAINTLVRSSGLSEQEFVKRMNKKAVELNLPSLRFEEPTGLNSGNVGNATDIARLLKEAIKIKKIYSTLQIGEYYAQPLNKEKSRRVWTTNWLLTDWVPNNFTQEEIAGKTGYITDSGYNFTVRLTHDDGRALRVVVLGSANNESRFSEARDLAEWTFEHYLWPDQPGYDKLVE